jgi:predicted nucleotidyltransferase
VGDRTRSLPIFEEAGGERGKPTGAQVDPVLAEIVRRLVAAYQPERIYLFGSHARGEAGPDSDYDLMVVVGDDAPPPLRQSRRAYEALWGIGTAADVLVLTRYAFDRQLHLRASLPSTIVREGRLLHAA